TVVHSNPVSGPSIDDTIPLYIHQSGTPCHNLSYPASLASSQKSARAETLIIVLGHIEKHDAAKWNFNRINLFSAG
ncbi:MAG: hypothetical protein AB2653_01835, partial [Candidatus Thiodiazotropha endolucinida]